MSWSFAIINNKLAEVFYEKKGKTITFLNHCYVKVNEYKTKKEQNYIKQDTKELKLTFRNQKYSDKNPRLGWTVKTGDFED